jgi:hypothetical protein
MEREIERYVEITALYRSPVKDRDLYPREVTMNAPVSVPTTAVDVSGKTCIHQPWGEESPCGQPVTGDGQHGWLCAEHGG